LLQSNKSQERRDWHIADKLDVRFHGTFGKKLTSVCVADSLFARIGGLLLRVTRCANVARCFAVCAQEMPMNIGFLRDWARIFAE
jgi:hypothetical protein